MKIIALDVGTKRIGVAKADTSVKIAVPYSTFSVDGTEFEQIGRLSRIYGTTFFVLGLPRNAQGEETAQSRYTRDFAKKLVQSVPGAKICFQDESLTSIEAEKRLENRGKGYQKGDIDAEAAAIILQDFLEHFTEKKNNPKQEKYPVTEISPRKIKRIRKKNSKKSKDKTHRKLEAVICSAVLVLGILTFLGFHWYNKALEPIFPDADCSNDVASEPCKYVTFPIEEGSRTKEIAAHLEANGFIRSSLAFRIYARLNGFSNDMKAGDYELRKTMPVSEIVDLIVKGRGSGNVFRLTILPGEKISSIKEKLMSIGYEKDELDKAFSTNYDHPVLAGKPENVDLEGYIFGETYEFYIGETVENIILTTLDELYRVVKTNNLVDKFAARGLSLYQGITLASIVQKEANTLDQPTVAQVFLSRLAIGMKLGSDVTTKYSLDIVDPERKIYNNNHDALKIEECHNTRLYTGLPCGPISNPGASALLAVANPTDTTYLYFLTGDDGAMYYSYTESEHNQNAIDHCKTFCNTSL